MSEDDLLRGYRPAGPPPDLRARIAAGGAKALAERAASAERPSLRDWLPAVAAVVLIVLLQVLAAGIRDRAFDQIDALEDPVQTEVPIQ